MKELFPYCATTRGVTVRVSPSYLPEQSDPQAGRWLWAYHIRLENGGERAVKLISRHWIITDAVGSVQEVRGLGVVGEQPRIEPGETYDYVSGCPLGTPSGFMEGTYLMTDDAGERFEVRIPVFSLDSPGVRRALN